MWPSDQDSYHGGASNANGVLSSSSSSRSTPSSTSSTLLTNASAPKRRTMEEVWKDIGLCSLHHLCDGAVAALPKRRQQQLPATTSRSFRGIIFQDFLAGPLNEPHADRPPPAAAAEESPLPPTALSLTPGMEIQFLARDARADVKSDSVSAGTAYNVAAAATSFVSPAFSENVVGPPYPIGLFSFCSKKGLSREDPSESGDRRHRRIIKNRESAARSRARKQAYINELELEVAQLLEENSRLNKELEELRSAMMANSTRRKAPLQRSSTAPF